MAVKEIIPDLYNTTLVDDIRETLGANGGIVSHNLTSFFSELAMINIWSKRKPVINAKAGVLTNEEMAVSGAGEASLNRYGITLVGGYGSQPRLMKMIFKLARNGVNYSLPAGGSNSPYRLSDFCGYYPAASMPIASLYSDTVEVTAPSSANGSGVVINYLKKANVNATREITFDDLYPPKDADGNTQTWKPCFYLEEIGGSTTKTLYENIPASWLISNAGKSFEVMQFLSTTTNSNSSASESWSASWQLALPFPLFTLKIKANTSGGGGGNTGIQGNIIVGMNSNYPVYNGATGDNYSSVYAQFTLTVAAGNGNVSNFTAGLYTDSACSLVNRVAMTSYDDIIGLTGTRTFVARLSNNDRLTNLYFGIYFNGNLQYSTKVLAPKIEI